MALGAELVEVRKRLARVADRFDPELITAQGAEVVLEEATKIANAASALARRAAARAADVGATRDGHRDRESWIGKKTGKSKSKAKAEAKTNDRLKSLPKVDAAARNGDLSPEQTELVAAAAEANPAAQDELIKAAKDLSLPELQDKCRKTKAEADVDPEATYQRLRRARRLVTWGDVEGVFNLLMKTTGDDGTVVRTAVDQLTDELYDAARSEARVVSREALAADALVELCQRYLDAYEAADHIEPGSTRDADHAVHADHADHADHVDHAPVEPAADAGGDLFGGPVSNSGPLRTRRRRRNRAARWLGILRIDLSTLQPAGVVGPNIEISGVGPVPLSVARRLLGDAVLKLVVTRGVDVLNVTHLGRGPSVAQEVAPLWSQPLCKVTGCPLPVSQVDHREPWRDQRVTCLANLDGFCDHHHDLKTYSGWALIADGERFVMAPPDDPRHPSHAKALANAPP